MTDRARTAVGVSLIVGVLIGLNNVYIAVLLLLIGVFIVVWGQYPSDTEEFVGSPDPLAIIF